MPKLRVAKIKGFTVSYHVAFVLFSCHAVHTRLLLMPV